MSELIQNFGIDWKLLIAQAVNFSVVAFILYRFAYKPILHILKVRKEEIEKGLLYTEEAGRRLSGAETEKDKILASAREEAVKIVRGAENEGKRRKEEIFKEAESKAGKIIEDGHKAVLAEKENMEKALRIETEELIALAVTRVLRKMEPEPRDRKLVAEAVKEISALNI